jgi:hypothetical protein
MRDFTDITIIPMARSISIDGEGYICAEPFDVPDLKGSNHIVTSDRIMAIYWNGKYGRGRVEGVGALEWFTDRAQVESYVRPWLAAKAKTKRDIVDALLRRKAQDADFQEGQRLVVADLEKQWDDLRIELATASGERVPQIANQMQVWAGRLQRVIDGIASVKAKAVTNEAITIATANADKAERELIDAA